MELFTPLIIIVVRWEWPKFLDTGRKLVKVKLQLLLFVFFVRFEASLTLVSFRFHLVNAFFQCLALPRLCFDIVTFSRWPSTPYRTDWLFVCWIETTGFLSAGQMPKLACRFVSISCPPFPHQIIIIVLFISSSICASGGDQFVVGSNCFLQCRPACVT